MTSRRMQRTGWNKRLLASTRGRILALLRGEDRTVNDLAAVLKLTNNAVRAHLISLERDGLVQQRGSRPGIRKPHVAYGLSAEAENLDGRTRTEDRKPRLAPRDARALRRGIFGSQRAHTPRGRGRRVASRRAMRFTACALKVRSEPPAVAGGCALL